MKPLEVAAHNLDVEAVIECFSSDILIRSPIAQRTYFEGIEQASDLFRLVLKIIGDIRFYETIGEGHQSQVIEAMVLLECRGSGGEHQSIFARSDAFRYISGL